REAVEKMRPYDVLLLDIALPANSPEDPADKAVGIRLLHSLQQEYRWACAAVVIQSVHTEIPIFAHLLQAGAADFIPKPFERETIFRSVVEAYKKARARQENQWRECRERRIEQWLLAQACAQTVDRLAPVVTEGVKEALDRVKELEG